MANGGGAPKSVVSLWYSEYQNSQLERDVSFRVRFAVDVNKCLEEINFLEINQRAIGRILIDSRMMVLVLDGRSKHAAHACWRIGLFGEKYSDLLLFSI